MANMKRTFRFRISVLSRRLLPMLSLAATLLVCGTHAAAQTPPKLEPLPETSLPPQIPIDPKLEPEVVIKQRGADKVEEFRVNGKLYMVRVTPPGGTPYILVDNSGTGSFAPAHGPTDAINISVPMWVIKTF